MYRKKKPFIIHAIGNFMTGGSSQLVVDLIRDLGFIYDQEVVTSYKPNPPAYPDVILHEYPFSCTLESLIEFFEEKQPDLVHVHYWGDCDHPWYEKVFQAAEKVGCRIVENINTPIAPHMADSIDRYVYVSKYVYDTFGGNADKSTVIYPGSDFSFFKRSSQSEIPDDCIGMVYRLETDKLNLEAIDPFIKVAQQRPQTRVLIVGGGTYLEPYKEAVRKAGVEQNFVFTGYVPYETLPSQYEQMSLFVAPVWKESFGQVSPFAMSMGIPVVGYDIGAIEEIIGTSELLAPPADSDRLADIIIALLNDRQRRIEIGCENQKRAHARFSVESMVSGYRNQYSELIDHTKYNDSITTLLSGIKQIPKTEKQRVVFFVHCFFPDHIYGTETYTLNLAKNLQMIGYEPIIVTASFPGEQKRDQMISFYEFEGLPVYSIDKNYCPNRRVKDTYYQKEMRDILEGILRILNPDIVHITHLVNHTAVLLEVLEKLNIPRIASLTDFFGHCFNNKLQKADGSMCTGPNDLRTNCLACFHQARVTSGQALPIEHALAKYPALTWLERVVGLLPGCDQIPLAQNVADIVLRPDILAKCYEKLDAAVVATDFTKKMYQLNGLNIPLYKINFGIDIPRHEKKKRHEGKLPVRFGFIGQIDYHKGTDLLLDAFIQLPQGAAELLIYGSENQAPNYTAQLRKKAAGHAVSFCGTFPHTQLREVLDGIDCLVIPSRWYENSPLILLSALASHTPVIVSDVEGMTEFVTKGVQGYSFALGNLADLLRVLKSIVAAPDNVELLSKTTSYEKDNAIMAQEIDQIYRQILQNYAKGNRLAR